MISSIGVGYSCKYLHSVFVKSGYFQDASSPTAWQ